MLKKHKCLLKIIAPLYEKDQIKATAYVHHFRLCDPKDIDQAIIELLGEAYAVGQQADDAQDSLPTLYAEH